VSNFVSAAFLYVFLQLLCVGEASVSRAAVGHKPRHRLRLVQGHVNVDHAGILPKREKSMVN
jgi:hypothetical protein